MKALYATQDYAVTLEIPDSKDWAEVANAMRKRIFGGELPKVDEKFDAIMRARWALEPEKKRGKR